MKRFLLINISFSHNNILEDKMDNFFLKETAFSYKYKKPILTYGNVLIPYLKYNNEYLEKIDSLRECITGGDSNIDNLFSIYQVFAELIGEKNGMKIEILREIDSKQFQVIYTDGSSSSKQNAAGYACCILDEMDDGTEEINLECEKEFDIFEDKYSQYHTISGRIENGTNNIGELTGLEKSFEVNTSRSFIVIISDSMYSIKCFREYIHVWKNNNYQTYSKKPIKNKELIVNAYEKLNKRQAEGKTFLFKWTAGHSSVAFNELCDEIAKSEIGIII